MFFSPPFLRRLPSEVSWVGILVVLFFTNQFAHGQELWPTPPGGVNFTVPEHQIELADEGMKPDGRATIVHGYSHPVNGGFSPYTNKTVWVSRPSKGEVVQSGNTFYYYPYRNREGSDSFIYLARSTVNPDNNVSYQVNILIEKGLNDQPVLQLDNDTEGGTYLFYLDEEEDTVIEKIKILDPDFTDDSVELTIEDNQYFELVGPAESDSLKQSYVTQSGRLYTWDLKWKNGLPPDYEGLAVEDRSWGPFTLSFNDSSQSIQTFDLEVRLNQIWEEMISEGDPANESILARNGTEENASELISASANGVLTYNLVEGDGLELKIPIRLYSPDSEKYQLYYKCDLNDSVYPEFPLTVGFYNENTPSRSSLSLASTQNTETFNNSSFDDVLSAPWDNNDFGYLSVSFIDDNFNSNINEPLEIELWAVPGLDSTGNRGGNTLVGKFVIKVEDDLNDPVIFKTDNLTGFQGSGESEGDRILFEINENQPWSYDFYFDDPDMEFSRGQNGANPLISITDAVSFQYSLNELQNKVTLSYIGLPDYESRYQGSNDKNNHYLSLVIQDAEDGFSPLKDTLFLKVRVEDANDDPYISEGTVYPDDVDPITVSRIAGDYDYNVSMQSILENQRLDISEVLLDQLQVRDEDTEDIGDARALDAITWEVLRFPEKGNLYSGSDDVLLSESSNVVSSDSGRITKLFYQPSLNEIGDDQFALQFFDSSGEVNSVLFNIFIINEQSTPLLDRILVNHDIAKDMDLNDMQFIPTLKEYTVFVNDGERPVVDLVFDDRSDNELISSILLLEDQASRTALPFEFVFKGDSTESLKFYKGVGDDSEVVLENYPVESGSNEPAWVRLELKEGKYWDFDSDNPNDKNASIDLRLTDESGSQSRYTINFVTLAVDEAPALQPLTPREYAVDEEQNVAALNLNAFDPEGAYEDVFWKLPAGVLDNDYFELRANGNSGSTLFAANNIGIYFLENPNFEAIPSKNEYNCTLIIKDTQTSGYETTVSLGFSINDINDAPRPTSAFSGGGLVVELEEIEEDTPRVDWPTIDLQNYFTDEDEDPIRFDESIFEHYLISGTGILSFTAPPDHESDMRGKIPVNVVVRDEQNLKWEDNFEVEFTPIDEPPLYNLGNYGTIIPRFTIEEDTNFTANSASTTSPAELNTGDEPNKLSLYLKDPEGLGVTINEQSINITYPEYFDQEGLAKNAQFQTSVFAGEEKFTFSPPANAPGLYVVHFDAIAGVGPVFTGATFEFNVTDVSDPPVIDYEVESPNEINPDLANVPSYVQNTTDESDRIIVFAHEGESGPLLNLRANDVYDRISPHGGDYEWSLVGLDSTAFKLVQGSTRGEQTNYLKWQTIPDYGNPPLTGNPYTLRVKLKEDSAPDEESDELKLEVWLISIPNERPQFAVDEFDYYRSKSENNTDPFIMVVNAFDPDADDEPDYEESPISYVIVPEKGDADRFEINATTRELSFDFSSGWTLDYENTIDADQDRVFEVLVRATKESMPNEPTEQWIRVQVENVVEPPVFTDVQNAYVDANFSIIEQAEDVYFEIFAESVDAVEKEVNLSLSTETSDNDNQFFEVTGTSSDNSLKFAFQVPPDFENPVDLDGDNNYTVAVVAECAGSTTTQLFTIRVEDVLFYPEIKSVPADNSSSLSNQVVSENESYILKLDVEDPENSEEHKDLLFLTSTNFGFMPVVPGANQSTLDLVDQKQALFPSSDELFSGRHIMHGDLRNVGTNDVIILDNVSNADQRIRYFKNANGFGNFEEVVEVSETLSEKLDGWIPNHGAISDVDDDGDLDLIISAYGQGTSSDRSRIIILFNNYDYTSSNRINFSLGVDSFLTLSSDQVSGIDFPILQSGLIRKLAVLDVDSDYDLDLVAIHSGGNGVVWYENSTNWSQDVIGIDFRFGGTIANKEDHGITEPALLETFDGSNYQNTLKADNFRTRDILISGNEGIFQATPELSAEGVMFTVSRVVDAAQINGEVVNSMKVAVFYPDSQNRHGVIFSCMDGKAYFLDDLDSSEVTDLDSSNVGSVSVLHTPDHVAGFPSLFLCEGGDTISIFTSDAESIVPGYSKQGTLNLDIIEPVISFSFVDLNRRWTFLDYEIEDTIGFFDKRRIKGDGRLFFKTLPDFDDPKGTGNGTLNSNYYEAKIIVRKAHYPDISATRKVLVRITDVDERPLFDSFLRDGQTDVEVSGSSSIHQHEENVLEVFSAINVINPEEGESIEFSIVSGSDSSLFQIDASSGKLTFREHPNFVEGSTVTQKYQVVIRVEEVNQTSQFSEHSLEIILNDGSELPVFLPTTDFDVDSNASWELNASDGSLVVEIKEDGKGYAFSLVDFNASDQNNELIPPPTGSPSPGILPDSFSIENMPESGTARFSDDNLSLLYDPDPDFFGSDELTIKVLNTAGHPAYQRMLFHVLPEPDLPKAQMPSSVSVEEGQLRVISLNGYDPDGTSVAWSLGSGFTDDFVISNNVLYFKLAPDYEDPQWAAGAALEVSLLLSSNGDTIEHLLNIDLENINDLPPASILDAAKTAQLKVPENQSRVVDLDVSDPDGLVDWDGYYVVQVVDSPDAGYFEIAREVILINGENTEKFYLQTKSSSGLDFENPVDENKNNRYDINIFIGKNPLGSSPEDQLGENYPVTVSIINQDETKPYFLSGEGSDFFQVSMPENEVFAAQVEAYDPPEVAGSSLTYSLSDGDDIEKFRINQQSGLVYFNQAPNYESPSDLNRDNVYEVQVKATDGVHHIYQNVVITVQDANDFPHVIEAVHYGTEDQTYEGNLTFADEDGDAYDFVTYNLPEFGELQLFDDYTFTYTPPADFASTDTFTVTLADPYGEATRVVEISLAPVNDPPEAEDDYVFYTNLKRSNRLQFNVLANDHPGVDAPAVESYTLVSHTQTDYSQGLTNLGNGSFSYTPAAGFLGEDTFTYIVADQNDTNSRSTGTVRIWIAKTADLPEWTYLRHFGAYMETKNGWIYHQTLGWLYTKNPSDIILSATWIWSEAIGWFWTGEKYFNWIYLDDLIGHSGKDEDRDKKWLLWQGDLTKNNNWFLKDKSDKIYSKDDFTRLKIRNEILEKNLDLAGLTQYILDHEYFSRSQVVSIIGELNRYKRSTTLNQILEFDFQY